jgi:hypothetical protein
LTQQKIPWILLGLVLVAGLILGVALLFPPAGSNPISSVNESSIPEPVVSSNVLGCHGLSYNITLQKNFPENKDRIMIYKVMPHQHTREDVIAFGQKFNVTSLNKLKVTEEGASMSSDDGKTDVLMMNTGWQEYHNSTGSSEENSPDVLRNLPSDEEAVKITTKFLKDRDLLPADAEVKRISHSQAHYLNINAVVRETIDVGYGHKINGIPVVGTKFRVEICAHGDPYSYISNWRNYEPYREMPLKTVETAFEELKRKGVPVGIEKPNTVSINDTYLAYRTKPGAQTEVYLEPVWMFDGEVIANNTSEMPVSEYVPALTDESVRALNLELLKQLPLQRNEMKKEYVIGIPENKDANFSLKKMSPELQKEIRTFEWKYWFTVDKWEFDPVTNNEIKIYAHDIQNESAVRDLQGKKIGNYTIQIIHDREFESMRANTSAYLTELQNKPEYQIAARSMLTNSFVDPVAHDAEVYVYHMTPENQELKNTTFNGWKINVYVLTPDPVSNQSGLTKGNST